MNEKTILELIETAMHEVENEGIPNHGPEGVEIRAIARVLAKMYESKCQNHHINIEHGAVMKDQVIAELKEQLDAANSKLGIADKIYILLKAANINKNEEPPNWWQSSYADEVQSSLRTWEKANAD